MQAEAGAVDAASGLLTSGLRAGQRPRYMNSWDCAVKIAQADGVMALWAGSSATVVRAAMATGAQMACYDHFKFVAKDRDWARGYYLSSQSEAARQAHCPRTATCGTCMVGRGAR